LVLHSISSGTPTNGNTHGGWLHLKGCWSNAPKSSVQNPEAIFTLAGRGPSTGENARARDAQVNSNSTPLRSE
jgi:hypothetical protein